MDLAHVFFKRFTENIYQIKLPIFNKELNINLKPFMLNNLKGIYGWLFYDNYIQAIQEGKIENKFAI